VAELALQLADGHVAQLGKFLGVEMCRFGPFFPPLPGYRNSRHTCPLNPVLEQPSLLLVGGRMILTKKMPAKEPLVAARLVQFDLQLKRILS
jgi:hypothetical protein